MFTVQPPVPVLKPLLRLRKLDIIAEAYNFLSLAILVTQQTYGHLRVSSMLPEWLACCSRSRWLPLIGYSCTIVTADVVDTRPWLVAHTKSAMQHID